MVQIHGTYVPEISEIFALQRLDGILGFAKPNARMNRRKDVTLVEFVLCRLDGFVCSGKVTGHRRESWFSFPLASFRESLGEERRTNYSGAREIRLQSCLRFSSVDLTLGKLTLPFARFRTSKRLEKFAFRARSHVAVTIAPILFRYSSPEHRNQVFTV